jgi:uncharacterized membrane protein required for colicin V production
MKSLLELLAMFSLDRIFGLMFDLLKGYVIKVYLQTIDGIRGVFFTLVLALFCLLILLSGFLMLHVALFLSLPWELSNKLILLAILGAIYLIAPILAIKNLLSKERLLKISGAKKAIDDLSSK